MIIFDRVDILSAMERKGQFNLPDGTRIEAEAFAQKYNFDWDDVVNITVQVTDPNMDPETFSDFETVACSLRNHTTPEDLQKLGLEIFSELKFYKYNTTPAFTRMNDEIDRQIDREIEYGTYDHNYSRETRRRQIINGQENEMWEAARRRRYGY
jgi:hypothetical protein